TAFVDNGAACASAPLCVNGVCQTPVCVANEKHCASNVLQHCNTTFSGWVDEDVCATPALCNESMGRCDTAACSVGQVRCNTNKLEQCNVDRTGYDVIQTCASAALCDDTGKECDDCKEPEYKCASNVLSTCNAAGHFMTSDCGMTATCDAMVGM